MLSKGSLQANLTTVLNILNILIIDVVEQLRGLGNTIMVLMMDVGTVFGSLVHLVLLVLDAGTVGVIRG